MKKLQLFILAFLLLGIIAAKAQYSDIHDFNNTYGEYPKGSLVLSGNVLYGMTSAGGANNDGCIFSVNTNGSGYTDLFDFNGTNGSSPFGDLTLSISGDSLFGMTYSGGANGKGVIFSILTNGTGYTDLFDFNGTLGSYPWGDLTLSASGNILYGMTTSGGTFSGVIFSILTNGTGYNVLYQFGYSTGFNPEGSLILSGNTLYGMTETGGANSGGVVFSVNTNGSGYSDLLDLNFSNNPYGGFPEGSLVLSGNVLYGMASYGGAYNFGCVFSVNTNGSGYADMHDFNSADGSSPTGSLILSGGKLYGMTYMGGANSWGDLFSINTNGSGFTDMYDFVQATGSHPYGSLTISGGIFYGMLYNGGASNYGSIFSFNSLACTLTAAIDSASNVNCNGGKTGSLSVLASGGTPSYAYLWSDGNSQTNATAIGLTAGTYTVNITDAAGCSSTASATITQPTSLFVSDNVISNVSCNGGGNGSIYAMDSGGTSPYTYLWSGGGTGSNNTGLTAGTYSVTVTDYNGCTATASAAITQPTALNVTTTAASSSICAGTSDSLTSNVLGGISPYTYSWSPPTGLSCTSCSTPITTLTSSMTYTLTVTDANGCTGTASVSINVNPAPSVIVNASTNPNCPGNPDSLTASGAISYVWSTSATTGTIIVSPATTTTYTVNGIGSNGCHDSATFTVIANCSGNSCSTPIILAYADSIAYRDSLGANLYKWYSFIASDSSLRIFLRDSAGVGLIDSIALYDSCLGRLLASASITSPGQDSLVIKDSLLKKGKRYYLFVKDTSKSPVMTYYRFSIYPNFPSVPPNPIALPNVIYSGSGICGLNYTTGYCDIHGSYNPAACAPNMSAAGPTWPIAIGGIPLNATIEKAYIVYDVLNCDPANLPNSFKLENPFLNVHNYVGVPVLGGPSITCESSWGNSGPPSPYYYVVPGSCGGPTFYNSIFDVYANFYAFKEDVTASFPAGRPNYNGTYIISGLPQYNPNNPPYPPCQGGPGPYNYDDAEGATLIIVYKDPCANYTGCLQINGGLYWANQTQNFTLNLPCTTTPTSTNESAFMIAEDLESCAVDGYKIGNGAALPYPGPSYWTTLSGNPALAVGVNSVNFEVTEGNGGGDCYDMVAYGNYFQEPSNCGPQASITAFTNIKCYGASTGSATVNVTNMTGPYNYLWIPSGRRTQTANGLSAGTYTVIVTDVHGCTANASVTLTQPPPFIGGITAITNVSCFGGNNGSATVTVSGGTPGYNYLWFPGGQTTPTVTGLAAGSYTVVVHDNNGCSITIRVNITQPSKLTVTTTAIINVSCFGGSNGSARAVAAGGTPPYAYLWAPGGQINATATGLSAGTYNVTVTDAHGCTATHTAVITSPTQLVATICAQTNERCFGDCNGSASLCVSGGSPGYKFSWSNSSTRSYITNLCAGTYTCTITDSHLCTTTASVTITQPPLLVVTAVSTPTCSGYTDGTATASVTGGTPAYVYSWNSHPVQTNATATGLSAGAYTVIVHDHNGCVASAVTIVTTVPTPTVTVNPSSVTLCTGGGTNPGTTITAGGALTYSWAPPAGLSCTNCPAPIADPAVTTTYTVSGTGSDGCVGTQTITVTVDPNCCYEVGAVTEGTQTIPAGPPVLWNQPSYIVTGVITIPNGATLNIIGSPSVEMASNAQIIVQAGGTLHIDNSRLWGCPIMWKGIQVQANSVYGSGIVDIVNNSIVEDALIGIEGQNAGGVSATINVLNSEMNNNYIDIQLDPNRNLYTLHLRTALFTCQPDAPYSPNAFLKAPHAGSIGYQGIYIDGVTGAAGQTIGDMSSIAFQNTFNNMNYGVYALNSNFNVYNNLFQDINDGFSPCYYCNNPKGVAVFATAILPSSSYTMNVGACSTNPGNPGANIINDCWEGVNATNYRYETVECNTFWNINDVNAYPFGAFGIVGVFLRPTYSALMQVNGNTFTNWYLGIEVEGVPPGLYLSAPISISDNTMNISNFTDGYIGIGIQVDNITGPLTTSSVTDISQNNITDAQYGIYVQGNHDYTQNIADNNIIVYPWVGPAGPGIEFSGIDLEYNNFGTYTGLGYIINNNISSPGIGLTPVALPTSPDTNSFGIVTRNSTNSQLYCNSIGDIGQCIKFFGNSTASFFASNTLAAGAGMCWDGFAIDWNAMTGPEGTPTAPLGNIWTTGNFMNGYTDVSNSNATNCILYLDPTGPATSFPLSQNLGYYVPYAPYSTILPASGPIQSCPDFNLPPPHKAIRKTEPALQQEMDKIVDGSMTYYLFIPQTDYINKQWVYNIISEDNVRMQGDNILQHFYDSAKMSNMGAIYSIHQLIQSGDYTAAQSLNNVIIPVNKIEQNHVDANKVFFNTIAIGNDSADQSQMETLSGIAGQCPEMGGVAVLEARFLLDYFKGFPTQYYDNCSGDVDNTMHNHINPLNNTGNNVKNMVNTISTVNVKVYPNPANSLLNVEVQLQPNQTTVICMYNSLGELIRCENLQNALTTISTIDLAAGIYYYRITDASGNLIKADKIMIVH